MSGIGTWIAVWLLAFGFVLIWWFMMDRLRDISRAIKGK
jgi:Na+/proline symporter